MDEYDLPEREALVRAKARLRSLPIRGQHWERARMVRRVDALARCRVAVMEGRIVQAGSMARGLGVETL